MTLIFIVATMLSAIIFVAWVVYIFNITAANEQIIEEQQQNLLAALDFRYRLIPPFLDIIKGGMSHEYALQVSSVLSRYSSLGTGGDALKNQPHANGLESQLGKILAFVNENYPDLKLQPQVSDLITQLIKTENDISASRRLYNRAVARSYEQFNQFPNRYFTVAFNRKAYPFIEFDIATIPKSLRMLN
ncbi:MAG: LemA family protein [bacterium]|nr:LemA family protein [bacterium]